MQHKAADGASTIENAYLMLWNCVMNSISNSLLGVGTYIPDPVSY